LAKGCSGAHRWLGWWRWGAVLSTGSTFPAAKLADLDRNEQAADLLKVVFGRRILLELGTRDPELSNHLAGSSLPPIPGESLAPAHSVFRYAVFYKFPA